MTDKAAINRESSRPSRPRGPVGPPRGGPMGAAAPVERAKDFSGSLKRLAGYLRPHRVTLAAVAGLIVISIILNVAGPKLLGEATNLLFEGFIGKQLPGGISKEEAVEFLRMRGQEQLAQMVQGLAVEPGVGVDFSAIGRLLVLLGGVYLAGFLCNWLQHYLMAHVSQRVTYSLREDVDKKLSRLPLRYYDRHTRGEILSRVTNDIDNIAGTLQQSITQLVQAAFTLIGVLVMMVVISPLLTLLSLALLPVSGVLTALIGRRSQVYFAEQWDSTGALNGHVEEIYAGHSIVQAFNREEAAIQDFDRENERLFEASFKAQFVSSCVRPVMQLLYNLNYVAICVIGGMRVASGTMRLGDVQAFIQYARQFTQPITQTASIFNVLQSTTASAERVFELLDEEEELPDGKQPVVLKRVRGHVEFRNVSFRYEPDVPLIDNLNLEVQPGQTAAIVGPTGAGKTTLVNLLMRFYEIDDGAILIDGVDIRDLTRDNLRKLFGMVLQDTWLFSGTIRENLAYGREDAAKEEIQAAARAAYVDQFVQTLPDGYDTVLDEEGTQISQGQKQLLTIARAFLADPEILILDEATSSVDTRTEVLIQAAMAVLMRNRTSFVIAHRLSTIRNADVIIVMNHGRIVEQGTHAELLAAKGFYYDLYRSQFAKSA